MINDDQRDGDRQRSEDSQPIKRKRITTSGNKSYDNNRYQGSSDSREKRPLFSSDKGGYKKPYQQESRDSYDPNKRSFVKKSYDSRDQNARPFIKKSSDSYNKEARPFIKKRTDDDQRPAFKKSYGQGTSRDEQSSYGRPSSGRPSSGRPFQKGPTRQLSTKPRQPIYNFNDIPADAPVRLNKYIANTGLCSRREADDYIQAGLITVNGEIVSQLGSKVLPTDDVRYNSERLQAERKVYILLNKPKDYVTSVDDPHAKRTVMELVQGACKERIYPVGRLDRMTTGVLLLTNDGELTKKLTHPTSNYRKIYQVQLEKNVKAEDLQAIREGVTLDDGIIKADNINYVFEDDSTLIGIEIHSGRNRIIRRLFEHLGYKVLKLDRIYFAGLTKKGLSRGMWRYLDPKEVGFLKMLKA
jgi:23S rRNA pseudouridine2605 synthase